MRKKKLLEHPVRMFREEELSKLPKDKGKPVVIAELFSPGEETVLVLNVYEPKILEQSNYMPSYRIFQSSATYLMQDIKNGRWRGCSWKYMLRACDQLGYFYGYLLPHILDHESEKRIAEYFGKPSEADEAFWLVYRAQGRILARKNERRKRRICEVTKEKMELVPPVGKDFLRWAEEEGLYWSRFVFYRYARKKQMRGWCTCCRQEVLIEKGMVRHNKKGICPNCKKQVTFIASGRKPRQMTHVAKISKLECADGKILYREFYISKDYGGIFPHTWDFKCTEEMRWYLDAEGRIESYRRCIEYGMVGKWYRSRKTYTKATILYPGGILEAVSKTPYQYCALSDYLKANPREKIYPVGYLQAYQKFPGLEYLVKARLYKIVWDLMELPGRTRNLKTGRDLRTVLEIKTKQEMELVRNNMVGLNDLRNVQKFIAGGVKLTSEELLCCFRLYGADEELLKDNQYLPLKKLTGYLASQVDRFGTGRGCRLDQKPETIENQEIDEHRRFLGLWRDFVRFMEELHYETKNEILFTPYDVHKEHDRLYKEYEDMRNKKKQAEQRRKDRKLKKYLAEEKSLLDGKIENKKFQLVVPESGAEIRREGRLLGHCVGSYTDNVLSGQCQIYFIRKKEEPEKPYYTVEWKKGRIVQCRGKKNCGYNKEMELFLKSAEKKVNRLKKFDEKAA